jgi:hypothetical protein
MVTCAALILAALLDIQYGTVQSVSGTVSIRSRGVDTALTPKSVGKVLLDGDLAMVAKGSTFVVKLANGRGTKSFPVMSTWQSLLVPVSPTDAAAYKEVQKAFDVAVIRRGGGIAFPSVTPVPCTLFTIVGHPGPYKVAADDVVLYEQPTLNQAALSKAMLDARDTRHVSLVTITVGRSTLDVALMPRDEEATLLSELDAADKRHDANSRHLTRALAFAQHRLFEFARYEVDQLSRAASDAILTAYSRGLPSVRPTR